MKTLILIATGSLAVTALYGQTKVEYGGAAFQFAGVPGAEGTAFGIESIGGPVVAGKPFSATEERHSLQVLGDGTRIESAETNRLYRDDLGRTRIERAGGNISIFDPVAGFSAELNPSTKEASKANANVMVRAGRVGVAANPGALRMPVSRNGVNLAALREELAQLQNQYTDSAPQVVKLKAEIADLQKALEAQTAGLQTSANIEQLKNLTSSYQAEYAARTAAPPAAGERIVANTTADRVVVLRVGPGANASVESLPSQMVNGALAQGTRTTETIPVGKIGNDRPIKVVNERWFSPDLQMLVKSTSSDPRFGDTTYQLSDIVQSSPDPSLFQIPSDYTIRK
jgi:hypothetical protein